MATGKRTLVREILFSQLAYAAFVGLVAMGCVLWVSNWVVRDNLETWAERWVGEMESLGAGFFINPSDTRFLELKQYLSRFPEIEYVRFYDLQGKVVYVESGDTDPRLYPVLSADDLTRLAPSSDSPAQAHTEATLDPLVRLSQAVTRESIVSGDLLSAESLRELDSRRTVVGYIELGLDYRAYDRDLLTGVTTGGSIVLLAFAVLLLAGRILLRRAIQPLADMEQPLQRIAQGNLDVEVPTSPYLEIAAVSEALETALTSVRERDQHLSRLANFDTLTGLASRHHFVDQMTSRLTNVDGGGALLFVDMDQFKYVNDTYGHQAGDMALAQIGARLRQLIRRGDLLGRFGGDEFVIFVDRIAAPDAAALAAKILREMGEFPLVYADVSLSANCSVGVAMVDETSASNPETLISQADVACRLAKSSGRNRACFFEADEHHIESIRSDLEWQGRLKRALKDGSFELHYQPIRDLADDRVRHHEALLRLREGDELWLPDQFLPAAVRFGLIGEIDHWVVDRAVSELSAFRRDEPEARFAINLGGSAFAEATLARYVLGKLKEHDVPPSAIMFEITEQVAVGSFSAALPQIRELREAGCEFAVDDFGTGYSSLSYLKRLPVQYIKIDGAFVRRLAVSRVDQAIVRAIAEIARIMGKKTVAEFVGDEATLAIIRDLGIDYAQGFHIGRPSREPRRDDAGQVVSIDRVRNRR